MTRKTMRDSRQPRRRGISFIQDPNNRSISFFKRRVGLFKAACDLSTLTGAKVAVVVESETGKMASFGTPRADPIIDCFLSGTQPSDAIFRDHDESTRITRLQNRLFKLEKVKYMEEMKAKENMARRNKILETSRKAKFVYGDLEDLSVDELHEVLHDLSRVQRAIDDHLRNLPPPPPPPPPQQPASYDHHHSHLLHSPSSSLLPSQSQTIRLPRRLPWAPPLDLSSSSSWSLPLLPSRPQSSSLLNPTVHHQPPPPPMPLLQKQHTSDLLMPQHPFPAQPWPQMTLPLPPPNQAYQHSYNTQGAVHINGDVPQPFSSQTSFMPALPPPVPPPPPSSSSAQFTFYTELPPLPPSYSSLLPLEAELDPPAEQPAENHAGTQDFTTADQLLANHQWPSPISSNDPYYGFSSYGLDLYMGDLSGYGGQATADPDMPGPSGVHPQPHGFSYRNLLLESEEEEDEDDDEDEDDNEEEE
ncbi:hypothetical protein BS78_02G028000 [Paspalum vaginatum]|nr:hypothetical protein BS78_02G028000 [Paspalum vaginatum]